MTPTPVLRAWQTAWAHICTKTLAGVDVATWRRCSHAPAVAQAEAQVEAAMLAGDVPATQAACQAWNRALLQALRQHQRKAA